jgi:catalase
MLPADGQLAGTPSVLFDAVAVIASDDGARMLSMESAAVDFVRDAFGHLKAIVADKGGRELLTTAKITRDDGIVDVRYLQAFIAAAKTRQWAREKAVRVPV